jgi:hypothetical protein
MERKIPGDVMRWMAPLCLLTVLSLAGCCRAATELTVDRDFLAGVVEKLPPNPFEKKGQYRGTIHSYRLLGIDPRRRCFLAACLVEGEFRPPVSGPISEQVARAKDHSDGLRKFRFEIRAAIHVEAGPDAAPRFRVDVDEIRKEQLEGMAGLLAKLMGRFFDDLITQIADGRASLLSKKLNDEVLKRASAFRDYGAFCGIDYAPDRVVLRFDLTRLAREGTLGYAFAEPRPGTQPLYRRLDRRTGAHLYATGPDEFLEPGLVDEGIACHVPLPVAGDADVVPVHEWRGRRDRFYTADTQGEGGRRKGLRPAGVAFHVHRAQVPGSVPFYRFFDPRRGVHFYTTHPHAEFAK